MLLHYPSINCCYHKNSAT